jgi:uncharacterized protein (DUF486 family)
MVYRRHFKLEHCVFEYLLQVPANRIGYTSMSLMQLKVMQEVITLSVFVPFALFTCTRPLNLITSGRRSV